RVRGGSRAGGGVGADSVAAGWWWAGLLVLFFVAGTLVSKLGAGLKERRAAGIVARIGARDARQVLANGGIFALCAVAYLLHPATLWWWTAAGALSAAAADTFSTEIGTLWSSSARSILTGERVPAGTSGGVSSPGTFAGVFGALVIAAAASAAASSGWVAVTALTLAGVAGSIADSLLGATVQHRRWCGTCETF